MPKGYKIANQAVLDLEEIWFYTAQNWSVEQADRYYSLIFDEIEYICNHQKGRKAANHIKKGYFTAKVKSHLIFFKLNNELVEIIRILHERMDIEDRLME